MMFVQESEEIFKLEKVLLLYDLGVDVRRSKRLNLRYNIISYSLNCLQFA